MNKEFSMQAECFYQFESQKKSVTIHLVSKTTWPTLAKEYAKPLSWQVFSGNVGEILFLLDADQKLKQVLLGTGEDSFYAALGIAANKLPPGEYSLEQEISTFDLIGWAGAQYKFIRYKPTELNPRILLLEKKQFQDVAIMTSAIFKVRDLINTPAEDMGPDDLQMVLSSLSQKFNGRFSSIIGDDLLTKNFPAIHAVGRAAAQAPRLLILEWGDEKHPLISLVGKGVCFDSGGLDLKPASAMRFMKKDMGGAAQVIGLAQMIMEMQLPVRIQVLLACVENTIDARAYRPGDIIRMRNGLHIEIDNTDAEGRLILADAISFACEKKPQLILDFATLTGAARTAVGTEISALFSNSDSLAQALVKAGIETKDAVWQLPLYDGYNSMLDSSIADMVNSPSSAYAGAITAALFLKRFVDSNLVWAHFDLMAWNVSSKPGKPEGGEAMSILAVFNYLKNLFST